MDKFSWVVVVVVVIVGFSMVSDWVRGFSGINRVKGIVWFICFGVRGVYAVCGCNFLGKNSLLLLIYEP